MELFSSILPFLCLPFHSTGHSHISFHSSIAPPPSKRASSAIKFTGSTGITQKRFPFLHGIIHFPLVKYMGKVHCHPGKSREIESHCNVLQPGPSVPTKPTLNANPTPVTTPPPPPQKGSPEPTPTPATGPVAGPEN